ncbi:DUF2800 domain-containing protein [Rhodopseudomonas palustris]
MSGHSKRSPSKAKRTIHCPGSYCLIDALPENLRNVSTEAARLGTATHALIERCLGEGKTPDDFEGWIIELVGADETPRWHKPNARAPLGHVYLVDDDMIFSASVCCEFVRREVERLGYDESELQLETRTNPLPERDDTDGTADITIDHWPILLHVIDYKNGGLLVEHKGNDQVLSYLCGKAAESQFTHERYKITIVQPNAAHPEGRERTVEVTRDELLEWQAMYRAAIARCDQAEEEYAELDFAGQHEDQAAAEWEAAYLEAGDHCTFCEAQATCPEKRRAVMARAKIDFAKEPAPIRWSRDFNDVAEIMRWLPELDAFSRAVSQFALRALENGHRIPGQKLAERGTRRKLREDMTPAQIVKSLISGGYVAAKDKPRLFNAPSLKSGPQIEKIVSSKLRKQFAAEYLRRPKGKLTIVPEEDSRPAIKRSAADDFRGFDDDDFG